MTPEPGTMAAKIAARYPKLVAICPRAVELSAAVHLDLYRMLWGRAAMLCGHRPEKHRREQLRGEDPITLEDLAFLVVKSPRHCVPAIERLANAVGYKMVPDLEVPPPLPDALSRLTEAVGVLAGAFFRQWGLGRIEPVEARILHTTFIEPAKKAMAALESRSLILQKES